MLEEYWLCFVCIRYEGLCVAGLSSSVKVVHLWCQNVYVLFVIIIH